MAIKLGDKASRPEHEIEMHPDLGEQVGVVRRDLGVLGRVAGLTAKRGWSATRTRGKHLARRTQIRTIRTVKHHPLATVGAAAVLGAVAGLLLAWAPGAGASSHDEQPAHDADTEV